MKRHWMSVIMLLVLIYSVGCQASTSEEPTMAAVSQPANTVPESTRTESDNQKIETPVRIPETMKKTPERVPSPIIKPSVTGEAPVEILDSVVQDLSKRLSVSSQQIKVVQDMAVVWNDGALGCPKPGMMYTQALVNGYWIILEFEGQKFDYRATDKGYFFLCENGSLPVVSPGTPDS